MNVVRALTSTGVFAAALLFAGCGDDATRPESTFQVPHVTGIIEPPPFTSFAHPAQIQVTPGGSIVVSLPDRVQILDAAGSPLREIPVELTEEDHQYPASYSFRIGATSDHLVVLLNARHLIRVLTPDGAVAREFTFEAPEAINLQFFFDVAAAENGKIFVLDAALRRIQRFTPDGVVDRIWGSRGVGPGQMEEPRSLITDRSGNLYVLDVDLWRVTKFSPDGDFIEAWDMVRTVQFGAPLNGWLAVDNQGRPVVVDFTYPPGRVTILEPGGGSEAAAWPLPPDPYGDSPYIGGVAVSSGGEILMTNFWEDRILRYSETGELLGTIGHSYGSEPGETELIGAMVSTSPGVVTIFDPLRYRMENYDTGGRLLGSVALPDDFNTSRAIPDGRGNFWCRNARGNGVVHLANDGSVLSEWSIGSVPFDGSFRDLELDAEGRLVMILATYDDYQVEVRSRTGDLLRSFSLPRDTGRQFLGDIALDGSGRIWVLDTSKRLLRVSPISGVAEVVRWPASVAAGISAVHIAFDAGGFLHVVDRSAPRILVFDPQMNLTAEFGRDVFEGVDPDEFGRSFAITPDGLILVAATQRKAFVFGS